MVSGVSLFQAVFNKSNVTEEKETAQFDFQIYIFYEIYQPFYTLKRLPGLSQKAAGA